MAEIAAQQSVTSPTDPPRPTNVPAPAGTVNRAIGRQRGQPPRQVEPARPVRSTLIALNCWVGKQVARFVRVQTLRLNVINPEAIERTGPYILAVTHLSHLEPIIVGQMFRRRIDWIARLEFYRYRISRFALDAFDCIPVNRRGVPVSTVRTALQRLHEGRIIGIFPEGGVAVGRNFVCRGGPMKRGACLISYHAGVPIIPCVVLGTHRLNAVAPWIPMRYFPPRRTHLWLAYGQPIEPPLDEPNSRRARVLQGEALQAAFCRLYQELRERYGIEDGSIP